MDLVLNSIGWIGAVLFSLCSVPQAWKIHRTKKTNDLSWCFLWMWLLGEIFSFLYVLGFNLQRGEYQYSILSNYLFNFVILCYIIFSKYKLEAKAAY